MGRHQRSSWFVVLALMIRLALGCLFVWSSLPKIFLPHAFLGDVYAYRLVGPTVGMLVAMILPWLELLAGICLLGGLCVSGALLMCMGMALMFLGAVSWALHQGLDISCGCFGSSASVPVGYGTVIRIIAILISSGFAYMVEVLTQRRTPISSSGWWLLRRQKTTPLMGVSEPEDSAANGLETCV